MFQKGIKEIPKMRPFSRQIDLNDQSIRDVHYH